MFSQDDTIQYGHTVILSLRHDHLVSTVVTHSGIVQVKDGAITHASLVGRRYGSRVATTNGKGHIHVLRPCPNLWTSTLRHRTQIIYLADIAQILLKLNVSPGMTVLEAGTGSGSMSHALMAAIGAQGHLYTFDYHKERANEASKDFAAHGFRNVECAHRNVCRDGLPTLERAIDVVFFDLPAPWEAIDKISLDDEDSPLARGRVVRLCAFSPCIEQVIKTVAALRQKGWSAIKMVETLAFEKEVVWTEAKPLRERITALDALQEKKERRRIKQIAFTKRRKLVGEGDTLDVEPEDSTALSLEANGREVHGDEMTTTKRGRGLEMTGTAPAKAELETSLTTSLDREATIMSQDAPESGLGVPVAQMVKNPVDESDSIDMDTAPATPTALSNPAATDTRTTNRTVLGPCQARSLVTKQPRSTRGHTSYLTFASILLSS